MIYVYRQRGVLQLLLCYLINSRTCHVACGVIYLHIWTCIVLSVVRLNYIITYDKYSYNTLRHAACTWGTYIYNMYVLRMIAWCTEQARLVFVSSMWRARPYSCGTVIHYIYICNRRMLCVVRIKLATFVHATFVHATLRLAIYIQVVYRGIVQAVQAVYEAVGLHICQEYCTQPYVQMSHILHANCNIIQRITVLYWFNA